MAEISLKKYKNLFGNAKETIEAIQRYIKSNNKVENNTLEQEEDPAASVNRILGSVVDKEISGDINKIIENL